MLDIAGRVDGNIEPPLSARMCGGRVIRAPQASFGHVLLGELRTGRVNVFTAKRSHARSDRRGRIVTQAGVRYGGIATMTYWEDR